MVAQVLCGGGWVLRERGKTRQACCVSLVGGVGPQIKKIFADWLRGGDGEKRVLKIIGGNLLNLWIDSSRLGWGV